MKKMLVTGASGFIGSFIVEEALRQGLDVWAAVRKSSSKRWLADPRIHFIELNLDDEEALVAQLSGHDFHYVVHAAGVTKCTDKRDFHRVNTLGTIHLGNALLRVKMPSMEKFVYMSSLSVFGAIREQQPYTEICATDTPQPNTAYGRSKLEAEQWLAKSGLPWVVLRPTGVYGPRERDYFLMVKSIAAHSDFAVGYKPQDITFVYVSDVVDAVLLACERGKVGHSYFLSDGQTYRSTTFSNYILRELGRPWCLRITAPVWVLRVATAVGEQVGRLTGKPTALNNDKYHILRQRNWRCDITPARKELGFEPKVQLEEGVRKAVEWYKENGWIK